MNRVVYTIGRQYGSGGRLIGKKIAEKENIPFYDKELLTEAAKNSGINEKYFKDYDEKHKNHFFESIAMGTYSKTLMPMTHKVILAQFDAIRELAENGPCVIIGRCADDVLKFRPDTVNIFIYGDLENRIRRAVNTYGVSEASARDFVKKTDRCRRDYYNYYTEKRWGECGTYDMMLGSDRMDIDTAADVIIRFARALKVKGGVR